MGRLSQGARPLQLSAINPHPTVSQCAPLGGGRGAFASGVFSGMTAVTATPSRRAIQAASSALLPELHVLIRPASNGDDLVSTALPTDRTLKGPPAAGSQA